jgi:hypothetical protein
MARIDALYLDDPCSGSRRMVAYLAREGIPISRERVRNLMRRMGLRAIYQKPRTTVQGEPSERFPCLVDPKQVRAVDQVWASDITYIPLQKGFLYLVAIVDLLSRNVLSWKLSNSLDTEFYLQAWRCPSAVAASQRSSTPIKDASSPLLTSWPRCGERRSRSAGQAESAAPTTSWSKGFGHRQIRGGVSACLQQRLGG